MYLWGSSRQEQTHSIKETKDKGGEQSWFTAVQSCVLWQREGTRRWVWLTEHFMKVQPFIRQPWRPVKPNSTLDQQCQGVERPEGLEHCWVGQDVGVPSPPAWQGSPQHSAVSSPVCCWLRGPPCLFCLHPCPVHSRTAPEPPEGSRAQAWLLSARPGLPQGPEHPTSAQPTGSRCRADEDNACNTSESEAKEQLRGSSVAICQVIQAVLS